MHLLGAKELNERIIEECNKKIEIALESNSWDEECFEVVSKALHNLSIIEKIERHEMKEMPQAKVRTVRKELTEFEQVIANIVEENTSNPVIYELIIRCIGETMEDLKVYHKKMYINTLTNLKNMML